MNKWKNGIFKLFSNYLKNLKFVVCQHKEIEMKKEVKKEVKKMINKSEKKDMKQDKKMMDEKMKKGKK